MSEQITDEQKITELRKAIASYENTIGTQAIEKAKAISERDSIIQSIGQELNELKEKYKDYDENKQELEQLREELKNRDSKVIKKTNAKNKDTELDAE